ncbi:MULTISPECIES: dicarboxylate/amino acid:cation symporter [Aeromonas]|jgi:Na+/H+-dicarboxylate symporter|uniref:Dicarboxylate/amino acid:cation symporter n=1 Tax=Aeromonas hydrophila TaxID=644 RepID=A0AAX3P5G3_AERHY|nr:MULTISPECIES: dicarboxylate/amino acid:cation symporter [Aeromonas]ANT67314.1 sodium:glutamate symporter [Aeromonas hydrophila]APJ16140.1 dicarboxylate/amino acid:cation symporter [Aeromonas hydrophila]AWA07328.1 dicarboxylate/amino acid:cation symporter [Aeromonas hydrophila subsp. hydrophila]EJN6953642.1 dicarboxylate/amino acid:cation symporter [Aeromonas hydrophila]ELA9381120.1 dicarboxylate/amino acid:cation symporter [Aeromonas hydrophila]
MKLVLKLVAGILAGLLLGLYAPEWVARVLFTAKTVIGQLITFTIPLIILFFIMSGIASLPKNSGKLLGKTVALSYCSTILAGLFAFTVASNLIPRLTTAAEPTAESAIKLASYINLEIPPLFGVMSALAAAFVFGIGISATQATDLRRVADQGRDIIDRLLAKVIIPLLPFYIAGVFVEMTVEGTVFATLKTFGVVLVMAIVMHWLWLSVLFVGTGLALGRSPAQLIKNMLPAYFTALGTMSSAATIPVALQASKNNGVSDGIANFTVPLCATIHLCGSTITLVTCATAVMFLSEHLAIPGIDTMLPFIMMLGVIMIAAPGAPGGGVMSALGLLTSMLGFGEASIALMIALYLAQDSFGTACNVTGDGVIALWADRFAQSDEPALSAEQDAA